MKTITPALQAHLAQAVTTLATCWMVVRTDGVTFAFTTCDVDLTVEGVTYTSIQGFSRSAIVTGSTGQVDNLEVIGFFDETGITEQDLKNGLFNYAQVYLFLVNWADLTMGILKLRRGWLGETIRMPNNVFKAELRGLSQALVQEFGNVVSPLCRADLGDAACKVPIAPAAWVAAGIYGVNANCSPLVKSSDALTIAIFRCTSAGAGGSVGTTTGIAGSTEPAWNLTPGATTTDGTLIWTSLPPLRHIGVVAAQISPYQFTVATPLVYPAGELGNTATIVVQNNVSAGTALEISDGVTVQEVLFTYSTAGASVVPLILAQIAASSLQITAVALTGLSMSLTNNSGVQGFIVKSGDVALPPGLLINDFAPNYLDEGSITWLTGQNAGVTMELKLYDINTTSCILWMAMKFPISAGDRFTYYPGCDKRRETCWQKFSNILNFRGEPDVPGMDRMLSYPDAS